MSSMSPPAQRQLHHICFTITIIAVVIIVIIVHIITVVVCWEEEAEREREGGGGGVGTVLLCPIILCGFWTFFQRANTLLFTRHKARVHSHGFSVSLTGYSPLHTSVPLVMTGGPTPSQAPTTWAECTETDSVTGSRSVNQAFSVGVWLFVCWLLNVPVTCLCITGTDLHRQFYVLPHWDRSCRSNFLPHPVTGMTRPGKIPSQAGIEPRIFRSRGGRLNH